jgi:hypothetical protein
MALAPITIIALGVFALASAEQHSRRTLARQAATREANARRRNEK